MMFIVLCCFIFSGCAPRLAELGTEGAALYRKSKNWEELSSLPVSSGKINVAVYSLRDQTGQYKPNDSFSTFSTAIPQSITTMLMQALGESKWFTLVEREGLQNLLTERKIIRANLEKRGLKPEQHLPPLEMANLVIEGGVVGYDTDLVTGGLGARYFGLGASTQYRLDQVMVTIRAVDPRTGRILLTTSVGNTIISREISAGLFRYVSFKRLLEAEAGLSINEPIYIAVQEAIEKAVVSLVIEGILTKIWNLKNPAEINSPLIQGYLAAKEKNKAGRYFDFLEDYF